MSEAVDQRVRDLVRGSSPEIKEAILLDLVDELIAVHADEPNLPIHAAARAIRDAFVQSPQDPGPPTPEQLAQVERNRAYIRKRLKLTPEDDAELQRCLDTLDDVLEVDEVIRQLREEAPLGSRSR
jgi:hypothetical protein